MKNVVNQLIQLQELNFALAEQKAANADAPIKQLEEAIAASTKQLPPDVSERYRRLQQRVPLAVVPIMHENCSGCGLVIPHALINLVHAADQVNSCPHCGRFLYFQEMLPRPSKKPSAKERPPHAGIARFSAAVLMVPELKAKTHEEAIGELANLLATEEFVEDVNILTESALRREAMVSTALENGLAFPHVRNVEGGSLTFALGLSEKGIKFGSAAGKPTKIVFLIVIPPPASAFYLRLLAGLVQTFSDAEARAALLKCTTPDAMWKTLSKLTQKTIQ